MTETSTTSTTAKTVPLAFHAVLQHALDHQLYATTIDAPRFYIGERAVIITADRVDAELWLDTLTVDEERVRPTDVLARHEHVTYEGRIATAIGDVRVELRTIRQTLPLRLVEAVSS